ncbi:MAG: hypothetical protein B7733_15130 [Myxococcales bacterium FL481]|nr:MAG: hypothetical protein B7733_15130 [Myxococcales bacterium FL481]
MTALYSSRSRFAFSSRSTRSRPGLVPVMAGLLASAPALALAQTGQPTDGAVSAGAAAPAGAGPTAAAPSASSAPGGQPGAGGRPGGVGSPAAQGQPAPGGSTPSGGATAPAGSSSVGAQGASAGPSPVAGQPAPASGTPPQPVAGGQPSPAGQPSAAQAAGTPGAATAGAAVSLPPGEPPSSRASTQGQVGRPAAAANQREPDQKEPWIKRHAPTRNLVELGVFGGVLFPDELLELYEVDFDLEDEGHRKFDSPAPDLGLRVGYYPLAALGIEAEGKAIPFNTDNGGALGYGFGGHLLLQIPKWSLTPFIVAGMGGLGVSSPRDVVGSDVDETPYFGGGVKAYLNKRVALRVDVRDILARERIDIDRPTRSNLEVTLGLSVTLGRPKPPSDRDGDGFIDAEDRCPNEPGVAPDGCPIRDRDGDGILDPQDACPDQPGPAPTGCPILDTDGDGILDPDDQCPNEPETFNGFEDGDGCPDVVPEPVKRFTGVIDGIYFELNKAEVRPDSEPTLSRAVQILNEYPDLRVEIAGHTDNTGTEKHNLELSQERAESVKQWLVGRGVDPQRLQTVGYGFERPIDTNRTDEGRARNRRIEFRLITGAE